MNKTIQGIIIIIALLGVSFLHPLNAAGGPFEGIENHNNNPTYVFTPIDKIVKLETITYIATNVQWNCLECIEDIINQYNAYGEDAARLAYKQYLRYSIVVPVIPGYYDVVFVKEYNGFWIFKIK